MFNVFSKSTSIKLFGCVLIILALTSVSNRAIAGPVTLAFEGTIPVAEKSLARRIGRNLAYEGYVTFDDEDVPVQT